MPQRTHEGPSLKKPPLEIEREKTDLIAILSLITVPKPDVGSLAQLIGAAMGAAYARGFEAGQRLATQIDRRKRDYEDDL